MMSSAPPLARALSIHADFVCGRSGVCCTSGWDIPIEAGRRERLEAALSDGGLVLPISSCNLSPVPTDARGVPADARGSSPVLIDAEGLPAGCTAVLVPDGAGWCAFFDGGSQLCAIQRDLGHDALPLACQHFPRVCLLDDRGISVTLSYYCPSAAALLFDAPAPLAVVDDPPVMAGGVAWEGLGARGAWPPLLRPGCLMDLDSFEAWERFGVALCAREEPGPEQVLALLAGATEEIRKWAPGTGEALIDRVRVAAVRALEQVPWRVAPAASRGPASTERDAWFVACGSADARSDLDSGWDAWADRLASYELARQSVEPGLEPPSVPHDLAAADDRWVRPEWPAFASPLRRYLASKTFASWLAYQGSGLRTIVRGAQVALDVVRVEAARACAAAGRPLDRELLTEAVRAADLLLVHLVSRRALARRLSNLAERVGSR